MDITTKLALIKEVGEEIITEEELKQLLETKTNPIAYDGFEPSGELHIAQGILRTINVNKLLKAGIKFKFWVGDWFAWANNKIGGDLEKIQLAGKYQIEVWKACGMDTDKVEFLWSNDVMNDREYWKKVMQVARNSTVKRIIRCSQIMGRSESESMQASQIFYPCMQCADIFHLKADITQLGMDQRKVNMLAREIGPKIGFYKPVVVSHHMLMALSQPPKSDLKGAERAIQLKMSKSKPETAIFMNDSEEDVKNKIKKAYCPERIIEENPVMEYAKYLVFEKFKTIKIERDKKFGGDLEFGSFDELTKAYTKGELHPLDLKNSVSFYINKMLEEVRAYFKKNKKSAEILDEVKTF